MAVLLIGSTGNGKSTLGNFLLNPDKDHIFGDHQTFATARTNRPETQNVLSASFDVELADLAGSSLTVIDTPGIYEDDDKDIEHMIQVIKALHAVGKIQACIFVVKFSSKIDTPYKSSVKYYSKLLPGVFDSNLIIAVTDYACDERSKHLRSLQNIDEEKITQNIVNELVAVSGISHTPKLFALDCLPVTEEEVGLNLPTREKLIRHIHTFSPIHTRNLKVAKTDSIISSDKLNAAKKEGEVTAYQDRLQQATMNVQTAKTQVEKNSNKVHNLEKDAVQLQADLASKDTNELVEGKVWSVRRKWKCFRILSRQFEVTSDWPIQNVTYWTNGKCRWVQRNKVDDYHVEGLVKGKVNRGLYAEVKLEVFHCDKYRDDIDRINRDIDFLQEQLSSASHEYDGSKAKYDEIRNEVESLERGIKQKKGDIERLLSDYLTMDECIERFGNSVLMISPGHNVHYSVVYT